MTDKTIDERLAEIDAREQAAERNKRDREKARRVEREDLREKYSAELGEEGKAFAIVDLEPLGADMFVVLRKIAGAVYRRLQAAIATAEKQKKNADPAIDDFIQQHVVHPETEKVIALVDDKPGTGNELLVAAANLYGAGLEGRQKK